MKVPQQQGPVIASKAQAHSAPSQLKEDNSASEFQDLRPEAIAQRKLSDEIAATSPNDDDPLVQRKNDTGLPDHLKSGIENLSGYIMDDVKVHYNSSKPAQLNAHAYAQGTDIHVASGQEKHLPHEAWHVVQQKQGRVQPTMQMQGVAVNDDVGLEKEADVMGAKAEFDSTSKNEQLASSPSASTTAQLFKVPYVGPDSGDNYSFPVGHTTQPASLAFQQIGEGRKKHHIIPDSVFLKYLEDVNVANNGDMISLVPWALSAIDGEIGRLREADAKFRAWTRYDDWVYGLPTDGDHWDCDFSVMATEVTRFKDSYDNFNKLPFLTDLDKAAALLNGLESKKGAYPAMSAQLVDGWRDKGKFEAFFNVGDLRKAVYDPKMTRVKQAIRVKLEAVGRQGNQEEYLLFSAKKPTMDRLGGAVESLTTLRGKVSSNSMLDTTEIANLIPMLTWIPANIMIGAAERRWEPGDDLDVEVLEKHPDGVSQAILTNLSVLLKNHFTRQGQDLIDSGQATSWTQRVLAELDDDFGRNMPSLLKQLTDRKGTGESTSLEPGAIEADRTLWGEKFRSAIDKSVSGLDYDDHRFDDLYVEAMPGFLDIVKAVFGSFLGS